MNLDLSLQRKEEVFEADRIEFESEIFNLIGFSWRVTLEVENAKTETPELKFNLKYADNTTRNTFYHKVGIHLTNSSTTVWKVTHLSLLINCNSYFHSVRAKDLDSRIYTVGVSDTVV